VISKCVLYAAKSTEDKHASIPTQLEDGRRLAVEQSWEIVGEFQDERFSAYSGNREKVFSKHEKLGKLWESSSSRVTSSPSTLISSRVVLVMLLTQPII
jgi:hypothetical protein